MDYHHGNGTQDIFYDRNDVQFISIHADPASDYPYFLGYADETGEGKGEGFNINYPLPRGTAWDKWSEALESACSKVQAFKPDALIVSLGVDTYKDDPISSFRLESEHYLRIGARIASLNLPDRVPDGGWLRDRCDRREHRQYAGRSSRPIAPDMPELEQRAAQALRDVFGYASFRGAQAEIVSHVAGGGDALVLMPTGGGKSLCFQIPALLRDGVGIVVSPLIALMQDQVAALREAGVRAAALNSAVDWYQAQAIEQQMRRRRDRSGVRGARARADRALPRAAGLHADRAVCDRRSALRVAVGSRFPAGIPGPCSSRAALPQGTAHRADGHRGCDTRARRSSSACISETARVFISSFDRPNIRYRIAEKDQAAQATPEFHPHRA